jgi:hypothetical protein
MGTEIGSYPLETGSRGPKRGVLCSSHVTHSATAGLSEGKTGGTL